MKFSSGLAVCVWGGGGVHARLTEKSSDVFLFCFFFFVFCKSSAYFSEGVQ